MLDKEIERRKECHKVNIYNVCVCVRVRVYIKYVCVCVSGEKKKIRYKSDGGCCVRVYHAEVV